MPIGSFWEPTHPIELSSNQDTDFGTPLSESCDSSEAEFDSAAFFLSSDGAKLKLGLENVSSFIEKLSDPVSYSCLSVPHRPPEHVTV